MQNTRNLAPGDPNANAIHEQKILVQFNSSSHAHEPGHAIQEIFSTQMNIESRNDPQFVFPYAFQMHQYCEQNQRQVHTWQSPDLNGKNTELRNMKIKLFEFCQKHLLKPATFFLAVDIMDEYLHKVSNGQLKNLNVENLHSIQVSCVYIACKVYERDVNPYDFSQNQCDVQQIYNTEIKILNAIQFDIYKTNCLDFLKQFLLVVSTEKILHLSMFCLVQQTVDNHFHLSPKEKAFCALILSVETMTPSNHETIGVIERLAQLKITNQLLLINLCHLNQVLIDCPPQDQTDFCKYLDDVRKKENSGQ